MIDLLDEIDRAVAAELYYLALVGALAVPDICGALAAPNGQATPKRFADWFDGRVAEFSNLSELDPETAAMVRSGQLRGQTLYRFRCSLLHQGRTRSKTAGPEMRLAFCEPGGRLYIHRSSVRTPEGQRYFLTDIPTFVQETTDAARAWLDRHSTDSVVVLNLTKFVARYPDGIPGVADGFPMIG